MIRIWSKRALTKQNCSEDFKDARQNERLTQCEYFSTNGSSKRVCDIICSNSKGQYECNDEPNDQHPYLIMLDANFAKHFVQLSRLFSLRSNYN